MKIRMIVIAGIMIHASAAIAQQDTDPQLADSVSVRELKELQQLKAGIYKEMEPLDSEFSKTSRIYRDAVKRQAGEKEMDSLRELSAAVHDKFGPYHERIRKIDSAFVVTHPDSYVSARQMIFMVSSLPVDSSEKIYNSFTERVRASKYGKEISKDIKQLRAGSPGSPAQDFATTDMNGNKLRLSSFKGKTVVILDFWASWCVPCRHGNPHMRELYTKYHEKGLDIIGVSDDDDKPENWKKAVQKDSIGIWHHVLRGLDWDKIKKGIKNEADISDKFGIHSLPTKILIDRNGKIIGRYGEGAHSDEDLDKKLASLFP
jgi:thiol-disulfide isomerase/thioredoxin